MQTHPFVKSILITEDEIQKKIQDLAKIINEHYKNSRQPLILVGVLRGCINFITDLMRYLEIDCAVDFMYVESYSGNTKQSSTPKIRMDIFNDIKDRDVLIVEDIIDSGKTLIKIVEHLQKKQPNSLRIMTFLDKKCQRKINIEADWIGFIVPNYFLIGYGLDYQEILRNLPYVAIANVCEIEKFEKSMTKQLNLVKK